MEIEPIPLTDEQIEAQITSEFRERIDAEVRRVLFGGYTPPSSGTIYPPTPPCCHGVIHRLDCKYWGTVT